MRGTIPVLIAVLLAAPLIAAGPGEGHPPVGPAGEEAAPAQPASPQGASPSPSGGAGQDRPVERYDDRLDGLIDDLALTLDSPRSIVWVFDRSRSVDDDREAIQARIDRMFESFRLQGETPSMGVVQFGEGVEILLRASNDPAKVREAIESVAPDETGTENVFGALQGLIRTFGRTGVVYLLVTDEAGDDPDEIDAASRALRGATVVVLGRESAFGCTQWNEPVQANGTTYHLPIHCGAESAREELDLTQDFVVERTRRYNDGGYRLRAGFGMWGLQRLVNETGGTYYYLMDTENGGNYDPERMARYAPEYDSLSQYDSRLRSDPVRKAFVQAGTIWSESPRLTQSVSLQRGRAQMVAQLREAIRTAERKREAGERALRILTGVIDDRGYGTGEENLRWKANVELRAAQVADGLYHIDQYIRAIEEFIENDETDPEAGDILRIDIAAGHKGEGYEADILRARAIDAMERVTGRHEGTPWADHAARMQTGMGTYLIWVYRPPPPPPPQPARPAQPRPPAPRQ